MPAPDNDSTAALVRRAAVPFDRDGQDFDPLLDVIGDARFVLIGEASHGTHEFYRIRADLTRRLVEEHGFDAVAVEADWPDAYRVNCYVRGAGQDRSATEALAGFERFPQWMWRNTDVVDFVDWLRDHNQRRGGPAVGFYGLDLYSLHRSVDAVIGYLDRVDPDAAAEARRRYSCFDHADEGERAAQQYGARAAFGGGPTCEAEAVDQLLELQRRGDEVRSQDGTTAADDAFYAEQNARLVVNAAEYYRAMFGDRVSTWNLRDQHMATTLDQLAEHLESQLGRPARIAVWEHNSHLGDARATEMGWDGEVNVGSLTRQSHPGETALIGFTTYTGTVAAADDWGGPVRRKQVRPALPDSFESLFHDTGLGDFVVPLRPGTDVAEVLADTRLERAIGVIYRPSSERASHYFQARLSQQFDAVVHLDETSAVEPLERSAGWEPGEVPDTVPHNV